MTTIIKKVKEEEKGVKRFKTKEWKRFDKEKGYNRIEKKYFFVVESDKKIIGFMKFTILGGAGYLNQLITKKEMRGKGIGKELIQKFEKTCRENKCHLLYLKTSEDHKEALKFYRGLGYKVSATLKNYEFNREWYFMEKRLK